MFLLNVGNGASNAPAFIMLTGCFGLAFSWNAGYKHFLPCHDGRRIKDRQTHEWHSFDFLSGSFIPGIVDCHQHFSQNPRGGSRGLLTPS